MSRGADANDRDRHPLHADGAADDRGVVAVPGRAGVMGVVRAERGSGTILGGIEAGALRRRIATFLHAWAPDLIHLNGVTPSAFYCVHTLKTNPVPLLVRLNRELLPHQSPRVRGSVLEHALRPTVARPSTQWARRLLYVRGHWLKMPMPLLAWHLTVKSFRRDEQPA